MLQLKLLLFDFKEIYVKKNIELCFSRFLSPPAAAANPHLASLRGQ